MVSVPEDNVTVLIEMVQWVMLWTFCIKKMCVESLCPIFGQIKVKGWKVLKTKIVKEVYKIKRLRTLEADLKDLGVLRLRTALRLLVSSSESTVTSIFSNYFWYTMNYRMSYYLCRSAKGLTKPAERKWNRIYVQ